MRSIAILLLICSQAFGQRMTLKDRLPTHEQIVRVECHYHGRIGYGSGMVLNSREVVTALHCVRNTELRVRYKGETINAYVDKVNFLNDWALLRLTKDVEAKRIDIREENLRDKEQVTAYGYGPADGSLCWYQSRYVNGELEGQQPVGGDSGGPILDSKGYLVGIISDKDEPGTRWRGYSLAKPFADWIKGK